jgi:SAM-dependent methyltransferase
MWYKDWFQDENYSTVYAHRDECEARITVDLFERIIQPTQPLRILDLACGNGRHAIEFARRGHVVTGVDLSIRLLDIAREQAANEQRHVVFQRDNMRQLSFVNAFDAVVSLFTSFGYFEDDSENNLVIASVSRALVPGGWFMLDFFHAEYVMRNLTPHDEQRRDGMTIVQERSIVDGRIDKEITISTEDGSQTFFESVRLFTFDDLRDMYEQNGFDIAHAFGDYGASEIRSDSPRVILFGRKR